MVIEKKAVYLHGFGGVNKLSIITSPLSKPHKNEVRIKIQASCISTTDCIIRKGMFPPLKEKPPFVLGYDFIGRIEEVGQDVISLQEGDWVTGLPITGGYTNYICIEANKIFKIPDVKNPATAAPLTLFYMSAFQMLEYHARLQAGDKILIHAATGSVGQALLQLGKHKGLNMVGTGSSEKHELIERYGAIALDYNNEKYEHKLREIAGKGFDAVFDCTNHRSIDYSFKLLKKDGDLVVFGLLSNALRVEKRNTFDFFKFVISFLKLILKLKVWNLGARSASFYDISNSIAKNRKRFQNDLLLIHEYLKLGHISPNIYRIFSLEQAKEAHEELEKTSRKGFLVYID